MGTVDSRWATTVDPSGLVTPFGPGSRWSLDWWVGADDRWHFPSIEAGVRQHLVGDAPVVETRVRIPGGDAVQRVYGIRGEAFDGGDEWVVVEVENCSSVPFAIAFAVRPATPESLTALSSIGMVAVGAGRDGDPAQAVIVDDRTGLIFRRRPARVAASSAATGDVARTVQHGAASELHGSTGGVVVTCQDGLAQAAFLFPVAHSTTIRLVLPIGVEPGAAPGWPPVIPSAAHVVAGWDAHAGRATRVEIPASQLATAVAAARRSILLAPWSDGLRHAGPVRGSVAADDLADAGRIVATLDRFGHHDEARRTLRRWSALLASSDDSVEGDIEVVDAAATHRLLAGDQQLFDDLLPDLVAAVSRLDRAADLARLRRHDRRAAVRSLATMAAALDAAGQSDGAIDLRAVANRVAHAGEGVTTAIAGAPRMLLSAALDAITTGQVAGVDILVEVLAGASPTFGFASPGEPQDLVAAALLLDAVRAVFVQEVREGLDLLAVFPPQWYGGAVELHDAPTAHGRLSYALRWHGTRPALLWQLDRPIGGRTVRIAVPGLDPSWATTEPRGETLLAEVAPPTGLQPVCVVTEHPGDGGDFT